MTTKLLGALALCAAVCGTVSADVTSANTVGFTTVNLEAGKWYMIVPQFTKTGVEESATFNALDVMTFNGLKAGTYSTRNTASPQIQVHKPSDNTYTIYYYNSDAKDAGANVTAWATARAAVYSIPVPRYKGFWLKVTGAEDGATLTVAGQVRDLSKPVEVEVGTEGQWQMVSNPFPCDLDIANMKVEGLVPGTYSTRNTVSPQMQVHKPSDNTYTIYYYNSDAKDAGANVTAWATARAAVTSGKICDACKGFWLKVPSGTGKLIFTMPSNN